LIKVFCSATITEQRMQPLSPADEDVVANQTAEVVDLKTYRERKAEEGLTTKAGGIIAYSVHHGQTPLSPFAMPVAFLVSWIFTPSFASVSDRGGGGAA
jgi:hypothetical protein